MTRPGFWRRSEVRRYLPAAIAVGALALLLLTLSLSARGRRQSAAAPATEKPAAGTVSEESVVLRSGPGSRSAPGQVLKRGVPITILAHDGVWCRVRTGDGQGGYLLRESIELETNRAARLARTETIFKFTPLEGDVAVPTALRLGPFSFSSVWGEAFPGTTLQIYSVDHDDYAVKLPDGTLGFVASRDVDLVPANPSQPAIAPARARVVTGITITEQEENVSTAPAPPSGASGQVLPPGAAPGAPTVAIPPGDISTASEIRPAVLVEQVNPVYPPAALEARVSGTVVLEITIDATGSVSRVTVKRPGPFGMTDAAVAAVQRWRYRPAMGPGGAISSMKDVRIEFQLPP